MNEHRHCRKIITIVAKLLYLFKLLIVSTSCNDLNLRTANSYQLRCTNCWCLPVDGPEGACPSLEDRRLIYNKTYRQLYYSFNLSLTPLDEIPRLIPKLNMHRKKISPSSNIQPVCSPYPSLSSYLKLPPCELQPSNEEYDTDEAVCVFFFENNTVFSNSNEFECAYRQYGLKTYPNANSLFNEPNTLITHLGPCGVCSNAQDLAVNLRHDLDDESYKCGFYVFDPAKVYQCFLKLGFTPDCAWLWSTDAINSAQKCFKPCLKDIGQPINDLETCELNDCYECDELKSGPIFKKFGGRTRRESGIITTIVRECDAIANLRQIPCYQQSTGKDLMDLLFL